MVVIVEKKQRKTPFETNPLLVVTGVATEKC